MSKWTYYLFIAILSSCVQKSDNKGIDSDSIGLDSARKSAISVEDVNSEIYAYCQEHSDYCELVADENDLTLDDYHEGLESPNCGDAITDENGDIIDPDAISAAASVPLYDNSNATNVPSYNAWQCSYCAVISRGTEKPSGGDFGGAGGCYVSFGGNHTWHEVSTSGGGWQCSRCGTTSYIHKEPSGGDFGGGTGCEGGSSHWWTRF